MKTAPAGLPPATLIAGNADGSPTRVITGNCPFTTEGLGIIKYFELRNELMHV